MQSATVVGRRKEVETLRSAGAAADAGRGSIVFLSGQRGSGKSSLLAQTFASAAGGSRRATVSAHCYESSLGNPLGPFKEVLKVLTAKPRGQRARRALELIREVAPGLLALIPGVGPAAALGAKAAANVGVFAIGESHATQLAEVAADVAAALERLGEENPLVVMIDDAEWIDASSTEVLVRLADGIEARRLLIVVAYDDDAVDYRHPLLRARSRMLGLPGVTAMALAPLAIEDVAELVRLEYGGLEAPQFAAWLHERTEGNPHFVREYLRSLEHQGALEERAGGWRLRATVEGSSGNWQVRGPLANAATPENVLEALKVRVADLTDDELKLLESGAIQGRRFLSSVLVSVLGADEDEILERLARLAERRHMITLEDIEDWWSDRSDLYAFAPGVLQELLYARRSAYQRRKLHGAVARALESVIAGDVRRPRLALLEIARQYEAAGDHVSAAARYVDVAESTFAEGADRETAATAHRAVELLRRARQADATSKANGLFARAATLALVGGEASWHVDPPEDAGESILRLADEAVEAAEADGNVARRASAHYAAGMAFVAYKGLQDAIAAYTEALALARKAEEPVAEFAILTNLAHQLGSEDLHEGWAYLEAAREVLLGGALERRVGAAAIGLERVRLDMRMGVAAYDLGRYGEALELLRGAVDALRNSGRRDDAGWAMSFLGQLYTSIGLYEAAEALLQEGISLFQDDRASLGVRSYLHFLLGRVYLEWEPPRRPTAQAELLAAREESAASGFRATIPLVEAGFATSLVATGTPEALREADRILADCPTYGWPRSEIAVLHGRARIALAEDRLTDARAYSSKAVGILRKRGNAVTATRAEEILLTHAEILERGDPTEARSFATQAAEIVREKADSLVDPAQRHSYLGRVAVTRAVLEAAGRDRRL